HGTVVFDNFVRPGVEENTPHLERFGAKIIRGDVRNPQDFERLPKVDAIINLAANPGIPWSMKWPLYDFNINLYGALNLLELARKLE
ncbi:NAD-dependent epimerase/dehydratase family protein, partial [Candidatus Saccharibacteria bacterium]|nr:NAD-dependent epimerase/dehydratase family protein [Candidatus Saccharibacteria bacterium]